LLAYPAVQVLDITGPLQVFATANDLALAEGRKNPPYRPLVIGPGGMSIATSSGLGLVAAPLPPTGAPVDTLVIAGGRGVRAAMSDASLVDWVRRRAGAARRVASVCTGAFLLSETGVLNGRRATTHWSVCAKLAREYPAVQVEPDPIFINDGPVWTSAGITAGIDLALALVEEDLGRAAALAVARYLVVFLKRPGGQSQFSAALSLQAEEDRFSRLNTWMADNLAADLSLGVLAREAGMSERTFSRRYAEATGATPARAVERLRVEGARHLLSDTGLPVKAVAARCGFGAEETMRRSFLRLLAVTPQDYRARFSL
jgi:transcriptional regulator GlxA family with amidase domain